MMRDCQTWRLRGKMRSLFTKSLTAVTRCIDKLADCIDNHFEDSLSVSQDELQVFMRNLKRCSRAREAKQRIQKLTNLIPLSSDHFASQLRESQSTSRARDKWFCEEERYMGGRIKKSSDSYFRLKAYVETIDPDELKGLMPAQAGQTSGF